MTMKVLKLISLLLLVMLVGCGKLPQSDEEATLPPSKEETPLSQPEEEKDQNLSWEALYAAELRERIGTAFYKFNLYDLDDDGIPELLISGDECHAASAEIFTAYQGKLKSLGSHYGSWGEFQYNSNSKYIFSGYTGQGNTHTSVYKIENGEMIKLASFYDNTGAFGEEDRWCFKINDKEVSKDEFDDEQAKYGTNDSEPPFVRKYDLTESEMMRLLE